MLICYKLGTVGLYCVTKGKVPLFAFCFCWKQLVCSRQSSLNKVCLLLLLFLFFVLNASPLIKPVLTPGGLHEEKFVYWNVSVALNCVPRFY